MPAIVVIGSARYTLLIIIYNNNHSIMQMTKIVLYLILLCLGTGAVVASEVYYIIKPSQSQNNCSHRCNNNAEFESDSVDNSLTLSQFINNSINYLTNDTRLIFSSGNYSMETLVRR